MAQTIIGKVIQKRYRVESFIASGAMKTVYKVRDLDRSVPLALKMLHGDLEEDPVVLKSFRRDAKAIEELGHPNIVRFYGLGQAGKMMFMLEEYIDGPSLKEILKARKRLTVEEALVYLRAMSAALGYAHNKRIVHCDVKPGNVMVNRGGEIKLTDFGIARHAGSDSTSTLAGAGTPGYMAPEQVLEKEVSPETDIYALGVMLYEMLTGQRPFRGTESGSERGGNTQNERIRYAHVKLSAPDPREVNRGLSAEIAGVVLKALAKDPRERYRSTLEFYETACRAAGVAVEGVPDRAPQSHVKVGGVDDGREDGEGEGENTGEDEGKKPKPKWLGMWGRVWPQNAPYLGLGVVVLGIAAFFIFGPGPGGDPPGQSTQLPPTVAVTDTLKVDGDPEPSSTSSPTMPSPADTPTPTATVLAQPPNDDVVLINAGSFWVGASDEDIKIVMDSEQDFYQKFPEELPNHEVHLDAYYIDIYEVTNRKFQEFVRATNYVTLVERDRSQPRIYLYTPGDSPDFTNDASASWKNPDARGTGIQGILDHPVVFMAWQDADAYCRWAGGHLPTEAQWIKAARGTDNRVYPWGDIYNGELLNGSDYTLGQDAKLFLYDDGYRFTSPVGSYQGGESPYGVMDMAGNVVEWVMDYYDKDYYQNSPNNNPEGPPLGDGEQHYMHGGSWYSGPVHNRISRRYFPKGWGIQQTFGFRCAYGP